MITLCYGWDARLSKSFDHLTTKKIPSYQKQQNSKSLRHATLNETVWICREWQQFLGHSYCRRWDISVHTDDVASLRWHRRYNVGCRVIVRHCVGLLQLCLRCRGVLKRYRFEDFVEINLTKIRGRIHDKNAWKMKKTRMVKNSFKQTRPSGLQRVYVLDSWTGSCVRIPPGNVFFWIRKICFFWSRMAD